MRKLCGAIFAVAVSAVFVVHGEANQVGEAMPRTHVSAYADIETEYWARGAIVDKRPFSAQFADVFDFEVRPRATTTDARQSTGDTLRSTATRRRSLART